MIDIGVVIVTYLSEETIERCIEKVFSQFPNAKICIYDNASGDRAVELIKRRFSQVKVIEGDENIGFGRGINIASREVNSDYLVVLNPDCFLCDDFGDELKRAFKNYPGASVYAPIIFDDDGKISPYCRRKFPSPIIIILETLGISNRLRGVGEVRRYLMLDKVVKKQYIEVCSGACFVIKKSVFDKLGGFDEDFFLLGEDIELCFRLYRGGHRIILIPDLKVIHLKGVSRKKVPRIVKRAGFSSMELLARRMGMSFLAILIRIIGCLKLLFS
ncbi:MAG: glycosyltransferase family 2 protein [bacterium]